MKQSVVNGRTITLKRVTVWCRSCKNFFRYMYPGTGPYRSTCPRCKKAAAEAKSAAAVKPWQH